MVEILAKVFGRPKPEEIVRRVPRFEELWNIAGTIDDESPRIAPPSASDSSETEGESAKPASAHEASSDVLTNKAVADRRLGRVDAPLNLKDNSEPHAAGECTDTVVAAFSNTFEPNSGASPVGAVVQSEPKLPSRSTTHRRKQLQGLRDAAEVERSAREAAEAELAKVTVELERLRATAVPIDSRLLGITFIGGVHSAAALRQLLLLPEDEFRRHMTAAMERQRIEKEILAMVALQQKGTPRVAS